MSPLEAQEDLLTNIPLPGGWDGRSRMSSIDTKKCPVYMLTGEYDWSNTPEMGQATCDKITGGKHQAMKGVGHFPATENPKVFVGYCEFMLLFPSHAMRVSFDVGDQDC
jgi:pimeloyl-ACP methyl ester carboxylesterase